MTYQTFRQRSALVRAAERGLAREPAAILGDRIIAAVGVVGVVVILIIKLVEVF